MIGTLAVEVVAVFALAVVVEHLRARRVLARRGRIVRARKERDRLAQLASYRAQALELERVSREVQLEEIMRALAKLPPDIQVYRLEGGKVVPIRNLPRERLLAPPSEWGAGLATYATFHWKPGRA